MATERRNIGGWTVRPIGDLVTCPAALRERTFDLGECGSVHEALIADGAIPHPDDVGGEAAQEWVGRTDWCFAAWIRADRRLMREQRIDLVFDHIDTLGDVVVNGVRVATTANEFVPLRIPVRAFLGEGVNEIEVRLRGPVSAVRALERRLGPRPVNGDWTPFPFLRKSACNFGWDWGPRVPTVGIGMARLEGWSKARIESMRPLIMRCDEVSATVRVAVAIERTDDDPLEARVEIIAPDGHTLSAACEVEGNGTELELAIANPHRWWPRGHGDQPLYAVRASVERACEPIDEVSRRIGLRTVTLDTGADTDGSRFVVCVNDRPIWCRGANWIPIDLFPRTAPATRVKAWIDAACDANLNMLRVWGGGLYERDEFYDRCDERGLLVWQDFMFACATYPEDAPYPELIEAEARHQVSRLSSHPSVVLWCGGNEDILAWWSWGWRERLGEGQSWGKHYWLELLPRINAELDPTRPYWPESPYSGSMELHPNEPSHGDRHTWDAKLEQYRRIVPRFCSEFGHQSPPSLGTLKERLPGAALVLGSDELADRQRAWGGDAFQYAPLLAERFPPLESLSDWIFAAQLLQARAYELAIGWMRANAPRCMGALFWQWNDVWRGHSWSVWDIAGRPKPAYFAVKRAAAPLHVQFLGGDGNPTAGGEVDESKEAKRDVDPLRVVLSSAAGECGERPRVVRVRLVRLDGAVEADVELPLTLCDEWRAEAILPLEWSSRLDRRSLVVVADAEGLRATHRFANDAEQQLPPARFRVVAEGDGLRITANSLLLELCVLPELGGALRSRASDGMVTLLPGEEVAIAIIGEPLDVKAATASVRCANMLGSG
jgi:beta-mannosidase